MADKEFEWTPRKFTTVENSEGDCPVCGSSDNETHDSKDFGTDGTLYKFICLNCESSYTENYALVYQCSQYEQDVVEGKETLTTRPPIP